MGTKDIQTSGTGGAFKHETNTRTRRLPTGDAAHLGRYGSLGECIERCISAGAYISFGHTSDGGAIVIRVLDGDDKLTSYCHSHSEVMEAMEALNLRYKPKGPKLLPIDAPSAP